MQSAGTASQAGRWIGRGEALARLGVKAQTLYAYVSRGRIAARPDPDDPRRSLYAVSDIIRLSGDEPAAAAGIGQWLPPPEESEAQDLEIRSSVSVSDGRRLFYRGMDAVQLAESATLEDVARRMWDARAGNPFVEVRPRVGTMPGHSARGRLFSALARRAEEDAELKPRPPESLRVECARVLDEAVDAVAGPGPRLFLHQRLARTWKVREPDAHLVRRALVLAADSGLDAPALAARAAAAGGASLAGAALAGLATVAGAPTLIDLARESDWVVAVRRQAADAARRAHEAGALYGFGDPAWPGGDPRAAALLAVADLPQDLARALREGEELTGRRPAFTLALVAVARRLELPRDAPADLLMIGRLAGLLAHALDQITNGSPIRARLRYVGPEPGAN
ncbi:citrate/2-methylcitrate synthase [Brevundimonas sp.]|uniref:citrate/2-methylcitrate synthase n=1 Tax=Brevundimonas sp. TaxID=1871086 RepID=UPI002D6987BA|nr:citrate/2-methylcitrate synthase [Brevundimonas sp.]HYC67283.1 citrate/2-methylcitrate synthase [Brevundimonas sp.]